MTRPNLPPVIGLSGYAQSGKDTVAGILGSIYGYQRIAFADALKSVAHDSKAQVVTQPGLYRDIGDFVDDVGWEYAKQSPDVRSLLQGLGVAARQHIHEDVWVDAAFYNAPKGLIVVSDMRFPNEFAKIKAFGGQTWRVIRPGVDAVNRHISEIALDDHFFDEHLYNDSSQAALADKIIEVLDIYVHGQRAGERVTNG